MGIEGKPWQFHLHNQNQYVICNLNVNSGMTSTTIHLHLFKWWNFRDLLLQCSSAHSVRLTPLCWVNHCCLTGCLPAHQQTPKEVSANYRCSFHAGSNSKTHKMVLFCTNEHLMFPKRTRPPSSRPFFSSKLPAPNVSWVAMGTSSRFVPASRLVQ